MCGRFLLKDPSLLDLDLVERESPPLAVVSDLRSSEVRPTQPSPILVAVSEAGSESFAEIQMKLVWSRWGFLPQWTRPGVASKVLINARLETLSQKPTFQESMKTRRCLVPMDAFYEWGAAGPLSEKTRHWIGPRTQQRFFVAGIWDWSTDAKTTEKNRCFAIVTQASDEKFGRLHDRIPVILESAGDQNLWLRGPGPQVTAQLLQRGSVHFDSITVKTDAENRAQPSLFGWSAESEID